MSWIFIGPLTSRTGDSMRNITELFKALIKIKQLSIIQKRM
jgi:hypothetical protein